MVEAAVDQGSNRTTAMDNPRKTIARMMVSWKRVFSAPRLVRTVDWAEPNSPPLPSLTCAKIISTRTNEITS